MISLQSCRINNLNWRSIHKEFQTFENCFPMRKQQREMSNVFYGRQNGGCKILARLLSMMWCDDMRLGHYYRMLQSGPWGVSAPILLLSPRQKPAEQRDAGMLYWNLRCLPLKSNYNIHVAGLVINAMQIYCDKKTNLVSNTLGVKDGHAGGEDFMESNICRTLPPNPTIPTTGKKET